MKCTLCPTTLTPDDYRDPDGLCYGCVCGRFARALVSLVGTITRPDSDPELHKLSPPKLTND